MVVIGGFWDVIRPALTDAMYKSLYSMFIIESMAARPPAISPLPVLGELLPGHDLSGGCFLGLSSTQSLCS